MLSNLNTMDELTVDQLQAYMDEYLSTLNDNSRDEYYTTIRKLASTELNDFMSWLKDKLKTK